jgi:hypothetical protein
MEGQSWGLGEMETPCRHTALVPHCFPLDSVQLPGQCKATVRVTPHVQPVLTLTLTDDLRRQHLQQTILRHLPEYRVLYHSPHTDPDKEDPRRTRGSGKVSRSMPREITTQILACPTAAGRIALSEVCV